jgi:formylmethanofuran dehydrogenase subunit E
LTQLLTFVGVLSLGGCVMQKDRAPSESPSFSERESGHSAHVDPAWLAEAVALPTFEVLDSRSAQGRLDIHAKTVTVGDLIHFHGHACDGLLRGAYAMRALADQAFPGRALDRTDLRVVSKNSPCLGDVAAYLTGARVRFGTQRLDDSLGVGFIVQVISTGETWEVREDPSFLPPLLKEWDAALVDPRRVSGQEKAELLGVHEATVWNWIRTSLLPTRPADHYRVRRLEAAELPAALHDATRTDVLNRAVSAPTEFSNPYEASPLPPPVLRSDQRWVQRYLQGPPGPPR